MRLLDIMAVITLGGVAACAQVMWAHGDANRLGEVAFWAAITWAIVLRPALESARRRLAAWSKKRRERADIARCLEEANQSVVEVLTTEG